MMDRSSGFGSGLLAGVLVGLLLGGGLLNAGLLSVPGPLFGVGLPNVGLPKFLVAGALFVTLWIVLIAVAIRWLFNPRGQQAGRLADLPADFDDWHRRAHAQMDREATARAGSAQP